MTDVPTDVPTSEAFDEATARLQAVLSRAGHRISSFMSSAEAFTAMVEAAAAADWAVCCERDPTVAWDTMDEAFKVHYREHIAAGLAAALNATLDQPCETCSGTGHNNRWGLDARICPDCTNGRTSPRVAHLVVAEELGQAEEVRTNGRCADEDCCEGFLYFDRDDPDPPVVKCTDPAHTYDALWKIPPLYRFPAPVPIEEP